MGTFISRQQSTITWGQCDPAGIVFNPRYFEIFDASTWKLLEALLGVNQNTVTDRYGILGPGLVDARANFLKPVRFGEDIEIASQIGEVKRSSFVVEHRITLRGELAVEGTETRVWLVRDTNDPERVRGGTIPDDVVAKFKA